MWNSIVSVQCLEGLFSEHDVVKENAIHNVETPKMFKEFKEDNFVTGRQSYGHMG